MSNERTRYPTATSTPPTSGVTTTVRPSATLSATRETSAPAGLLLFHPRGEPPALTFRQLGTQACELGRAPDCSVRLADEQVSRVHARFEALPGDACRMTDLDSANGSFVDGQRVGEALLTGDEVVRLGGTLLRYRPHGPVASDALLPVETRGLLSGPALTPLRELVLRGADSDLSFLIAGETGTGKELVARLLHEAGRWRAGPFVAVNCAAIPKDLVESELFGHVKGAFSGADADRAGLVREAQGGTLFLDELGELPLASQAKLLRVLQERRVRPVGGTRDVAVELRVVSASNRDLAAMIEHGTFRGDLYARLAEVVVTLPPLRDRFEDIPLLVAHFLAKHGARGAQSTVSAELLEALCLRRWPFNVRELESAVRRALLLAGADPLRSDHFDGVGGGPRKTEQLAELAQDRDPPSSAGAACSDDPEVRALVAALERHAGDTEAAAAELGISRSQLYRRAKQAGIVAAHFKRAEPSLGRHG